MMEWDLRYTLVCDGSSDAALLPIITWTLRANGVDQAIQPAWADLRSVPNLKPKSLTDRLRAAMDYYPCDLLLIHRDAENRRRTERVHEIQSALAELARDREGDLPAVCIVPVRMTEAWLLFDEAAIKRAAGNKHYSRSLSLPPLKQIEQETDPKAILHDRLKQASGLTGRRLKTFSAGKRVHRLAGLIEDYAPLRALTAFNAFENDLKTTIPHKNRITT